MKKQIVSIIALFIVSFSFAQNGFNYKALISDNGNVLSNQVISIKFTVLENGSTSVYQETQTGNTDANGIIAFNIGEGSVVSGDFTTIDWGSNPYFLKVEINTGSGYQDFGTTEFKAVPYAKFAEKAGNTFSGDFGDLSNVPAGLSDGDDDTHLTDAQITAMGYIKNANDADHDATNEIQNLTLNSTQLSISNGNNVNFTGWDNNAADDFDGDFTSLSNVPTGLSDGDDDTHLTETQVDNYVANNGYISLDSADPTTLEIQNNSTSSTVKGIDILVNSNNNKKNGVDITLQGTTQTNGTSSAIHIRNELVSSQNQFGIYNQLSGSSTTTSYDATGLYNFVGSSSGYMGDVTGVSNKIYSNQDGLHKGINTIIDNSGNGDHIGVYSKLSGAGTGVQYGNENIITNSNNSNHYGNYSYLDGNGTGKHHGTYNTIGGSGTGDQYGVYNYIINSGNGTHYGTKSYLNGSGTGMHYGVHNTIGGSGTGVQYGIQNNIFNSGNGTHYGINSYLNGSGTGDKYGSYNRILSTAGGTHYAVYGEAKKAGSYAGYFVGDVYTSKKLKAPDSGDTDMKAYIYGSITSNGGYTSGGAHSGGFSVTNPSTGVYKITFTGSNKPTSSDQYTVMVNMRFDHIGFITVRNRDSFITVRTYNTSGTAANEPFNFVVFKK